MSEEKAVEETKRDWVQKDIQIIMKDSGSSDFLEGAKIINLSGLVRIHRAEKEFIKLMLDEAPETMRFTLIEEMPRVQKEVISAVTSERNVTLHFSDGSSQVIASTPAKKEEPEEEWD